MHDRDFDELWAEGAVATTASFDPVRIARLPEIARRYLAHAIGRGALVALVATAVRLQMHGEIKLKNNWCSFEADQVIRWPRGFMWRGRA